MVREFRRPADVNASNMGRLLAAPRYQPRHHHRSNGSYGVLGRSIILFPERLFRAGCEMRVDEAQPW
jgi:hypothetical protein